MKQNVVYIGNIPVGDGYPTVFMAELSTYYNQDIDKAIGLIDKAIDAGCEIIKTEILHDSDVILKKANLQHTFNYVDGKKTENYRKLIEQKTVSIENYKKIINYVTKVKKVPFVASCYDFEGVDFLVQNGGHAIKLWKNNYNNIPLIKYAAKSGLPIIFDISNIYLDELAKIVRIAQINQVKGIIVNHHPGKTPTPAEDHNMSVVRKYKETLDIPVGLSCHYIGNEMMYVGVGLGVNIIEKGVYDNPKEDDQGVMITADINDLENIIYKVKNCWKALGNEYLSITEPRDTKTLNYGLSSKCLIRKGEKLSKKNVKFSFPAIGIEVEHWDLVKGKIVKNEIAPKSEIRWQDVTF